MEKAATGNSHKIILVSAFEPFNGDDINPTQQILEKLPANIDGCTIAKYLLPVEFIKAPEMLKDEYDRLSPSAVIMLGQAGRRNAITPETTAVNLMNASIPDNAGFKPVELPIIDNGSETLKSTLPVDAVVGAINKSGLPAKLSDDAGRYVCNNVFYYMAYHVGNKVPTGFIHVPFIREQVHENLPFMEFEDLYKGIVIAIKTVINELKQ